MDYKKIVAEEIQKLVSEHLTYDQVYQLLEVPKYTEHGDVAFPAFALAKALRKAPQAIAGDLAAQLNHPYIEKVEAVGPYVNLFLEKAAVSNAVLHEIAAEKQAFGTADIGKGGNVPIDMSSPNIAKPISMGHLRSTVIGNSLANIMKKVGFNPIKINHLGDWGTQFGKLIVAYKLWGNEEKVKAEPINELLTLYVRFHSEAETDDTLNDEARAWFKKLEDGDAEALHLWEWFRSESLQEFMKIYDMLGITFDSF
ncbi:MAG: arginine--tRNA ligase, partial [Trichococcus flocculiformis]